MKMVSFICNDDGTFVPCSQGGEDFLAEYRAALAAKEDLETQVKNLEEYMLKGVAFRDELQAAKDVAYRERNQFVLFLTRCFPSHRCKHPESDAAWERGWMNIICVHGPQGQMGWHIHDSELPAYEHLPLEENHWDGHTTEEKYVRLYRCDMNSPEIGALRREVDRLQTNECIIADERFDMERGLIARAEKAEAALCRAREAMTSRPSDNAPLASDVLGFRVAEAIAALSTFFPCPHEEETNRLREAVEWAIYVVHNNQVENNWGKEGFEAELRRRAGREG